VRKRGIATLAGTAIGLGAGLVAQRSVVKRRRLNDPYAAEPYGDRRGVRARHLELPDGARLFVEEAGPQSRRGAVFVHGSALRTDMWHHQLEGLDDHRLVFFDLRGHGRSQPKGEQDFAISTLAADLETVVEESELDEVVLVGHSIGGMIALQLCCLRSEWLGSRIRGLVLCNTTYRPAYDTSIGGAVVSKLERVVRHPLDLLGGYHDGIDRLRRIVRPTDQIFLAVSYAAFGPGASAKQIDFVYDMLADTPADVLFDLIRSYRDYDVRELLDQVTVPALVVTGTHDRLTVPKASRFLAEHLSKGELRVFDGCGHMTMLERPEAFNEMLGRFLSDVLGGPAAKEEKAR
jgi:pimeloyl-ACP methyl ester carboxylesterase